VPAPAAVFPLQVPRSREAAPCWPTRLPEPASCSPPTAAMAAPDGRKASTPSAAEANVTASETARVLRVIAISPQMGAKRRRGSKPDKEPDRRWPIFGQVAGRAIQRQFRRYRLRAAAALSVRTISLPAVGLYLTCATGFLPSILSERPMRVICDSDAIVPMRLARLNLGGAAIWTQAEGTGCPRPAPLTQGRMCPAAVNRRYHSSRVSGTAEPAADSVTRPGLVVPSTTCILAG
jgi:hypothetical protein